MKTNGKTKLKKGDHVLVIAGKDRGKEGDILRIDRQKDRVWVSSCNVLSKALKPDPRNPSEKGKGFAQVESSIHISNVMLKSSKGPTRLGYRFENDKKIRYAKKTGEAC